MTYIEPIIFIGEQNLSWDDNNRIRALLIFEKIGLARPSDQYGDKTMGFIFAGRSSNLRIEITAFSNGDVSIIGNQCPPSPNGDLLIDMIAEEFQTLWQSGDCEIEWQE